MCLVSDIGLDMDVNCTVYICSTNPISTISHYEYVFKTILVCSRQSCVCKLLIGGV